MKQYRNKETGEIVGAKKIHIYKKNFYVITGYPSLLDTLFEQQYEELTNDK